MNMKQMTKDQLTDAVNLYFKTLAYFGRTPSSDIGPKGLIIEKESQFLKYLDMMDIQCSFCYMPFVIIQIDYRTQRPVWGCREDMAMKGLQKIKWSNHCGDCGVFLNLSKELLADQEKYMDNGQSSTVCDRCIGNGNILTQDDMKRVRIKKKVSSN